MHDDLSRWVVTEISADPRLYGETFDTSVSDGTVTLRGTVASLRLKRAASSAVARVRGVTWIDNELTVQLPVQDRRSDEDLRGDVMEALMLDTWVPMTVEASVRNGAVTLTGSVQWHYQREAAESRAIDVPGVAGIDNAIVLTQAPNTDAAGVFITGAFRRNALLAGHTLSARASTDGRVTLSGTVSSWVAHDEAVATAWSAPGVTQVASKIRVTSPP